MFYLINHFPPGSPFACAGCRECSRGALALSGHSLADRAAGCPGYWRPGCSGRRGPGCLRHWRPGCSGCRGPGCPGHWRPGWSGRRASGSGLPRGPATRLVTTGDQNAWDARAGWQEEACPPCVPRPKEPPEPFLRGRPAPTPLPRSLPAIPRSRESGSRKVPRKPLRESRPGRRGGAGARGSHCRAQQSPNEPPVPPWARLPRL